MAASKIKKLQQTLKTPLLVKNPGDLFYLTGFELADGGLLLVTKKQAVLFGGYLEKVSIVKVDSIRNIKKYLGTSKTLQIDNHTNLKEFNFVKKLLPKINLKAIDSPVAQMRLIKTSDELVKMKQAYQITVKVFNEVKKALKAKKIWTEIELAMFIKLSGLELGADDISFPVIVAAGSNAAVPHHVPTAKTIKPGESVVLDFGFKIDGYCSDFTRTVFLKKISPEMTQIYLAVEESYKLGIKTAGHNVVAKTVDLAARAKLGEYNLSKYFIHSLGHGTGLDVHEAPHVHEQSGEVLKNGMVFSIEPGVYVPRFGGVRIEDLIYLKNGKAEIFAKASTALKDIFIS